MHCLVFFLRFDLEDCEHEIFDILSRRLLSLVLQPPLSKVLHNLLLHIAHVETRAANGEGRKGHLSHRLGCVLQSGDHFGIKLYSSIQKNWLIKQETCSSLHCVQMFQLSAMERPRKAAVTSSQRKRSK